MKDVIPERHVTNIIINPLNYKKMENTYSLTNWVMLLSSQRNMTEWTISKMALAKYIAKISFGR